MTPQKYLLQRFSKKNINTTRRPMIVYDHYNNKYNNSANNK